MMIKYYEVKEEKLEDTAKFMRRIFYLTKWLSKRYSVSAEDVHMNYGWVNDQFARNRFTIKIEFR